MDGLKVERHQGKRFTATPLALAKVFHGLRVLGITDQVEAPQAFYSQDFAFSQGFTGSLDGSFTVRQLLPTFLVPNLRSADRAGNRLGMETPVGGVLVLRRATWAERETRHGSVGTIVRDTGHNRKPWSAIGTVDEGIAVAAVGWIK